MNGPTLSRLAAEAHTRVETLGMVAVLTMDRPPVNALNAGMLRGLADLIVAVGEDTNCVVVTGGPDKFSAGVDINDLKAAPPSDAIPRNAAFQSCLMSIERSQAPVVAAVNGYALGGGMELALACDIRVASEGAFFGLPEVTLGGLPGIGGMQRLQRIVGMGKAKQFVLSGERFAARECHRLGLVDELTESADAREDAVRLAQAIASQPVVSVRAGKQAINLGADIPIERAQALDLRFCGQVAWTKDRGESLSAFLEKRRPRLEGR